MEAGRCASVAKVLVISLAFFFSLSAVARSEMGKGPDMTIQINGRVLTATLADNTSARALADLLKEKPLTLVLEDYGNFEKYGPLPQSLPTNDEPLDTDSGDLILYQGRYFVMYYDRNSWTFTRLGRLKGITKEELKQLLGTGTVTATLSLPGQP